MQYCKGEVYAQTEANHRIALSCTFRNLGSTIQDARSAAFSSALVNLLSFIASNDDIDLISQHVVDTAKSLVHADVVNLYFVGLSKSKTLMYKHMSEYLRQRRSADDN